MKGRIHNLDTLEKEIYRLKVKQKEQEHGLRQNISSIQKMGLLKILGVAFFTKKDAAGNDRVSRFWDRFAENMSSRLADRANDFLDWIFRKKNR